MANGDISKMPQMTQSPHGQCIDADHCSVTFTNFLGPSIAINDLDFYINDYHLVIATLHNLPKTRVLEKHELEFK